MPNDYTPPSAGGSLYLFRATAAALSGRCEGTDGLYTAGEGKLAKRTLVDGYNGKLCIEENVVTVNPVFEYDFSTAHGFVDGMRSYRENS